MKKIIILFFVIVNNLLLVANAATWVQLDDNNYIDKESIKVYVNDNGEMDYNKRSFWMKYTGNENYKDIESINKKDISYELAEYIIDYSKGTIAVKAGNLYDKSGENLNSFTFGDYELNWHRIAPNSNAELWAELIKKRRMLNKMYKLQQH